MELPQAAEKNMYRVALVSAIAGLIYLVYLFTFTGLFKTGDERLLVDVTNSLVLQKSNYVSQTTHIWGLQPIMIELAHPLLAAPLYWIAYQIPAIGNVHTIFLFNLFVTVLTAIILFHYVLELGYTDRTAAIAALLFGLTTIAWPYAQTFFRDPLAGLLLFGSVFSLEKWRKAFGAEKSQQWKWLVISIVVIICALLCKDVMLIALPALAVFAYPGSVHFKKHWRTIVTIGIGLLSIIIVLGIVLFVLREQAGLAATRYRVFTWADKLVGGLPEAWKGVAGFWLSPGKGIWWYSPILFLALGAPFVIPHHRWRESWFPLALLMWFTIIYAGVKGPYVWSGGAGWGPRYMVPMTPIMMLAAIPLIDRMLNSSHWWPKAALVALSLYGTLIQIGGTYVNLYSYYAQIEAGTGHFVWTGPAIWSFRWSQAIGSLLFLPQAPTDILWLNPPINRMMIGLLSSGIVLLAGAVICLLCRPGLARRAQIRLAGISPVLVVVMTTTALLTARHDPQYQSDNPDLTSLRDYLSQNADAQDIIILSNSTYVPYFTNWYKGKAIWYSLPSSPGERSSWEQEPEVISDNVDDLVAPNSIKIFEETRQGGALYRGGVWWLVVNSSPFHSWSNRPPEWYLAKHAYTVGVTEFSPTVRLIAYLPLQAPSADMTPAQAVDAGFGETIRLQGYDIAVNSDVNTTDQVHMLGISLLWEAIEPMPIDYTVGVYLLDPGGAVVLQQDRWPVGGFAPTSQWKPGEPIRDNYGFVIPPTFPPGEYRFAIAVYDWVSMERLPVVGPDNVEQGDLLMLETIAID
ncbi:MAG: hypothetical protein JXB07_16840 [Anaerolineae bacterium]|nr:hypothetical protein [Anaerolineae bacterium]